MNKQKLIDRAKLIPQDDGPRFSWTYRCKRIHERIVNGDDLENFLSWPTVRGSLYVGKRDEMEHEYADVMAGRYKDVIGGVTSMIGGISLRYHYAHQLWMLDKLPLDISKLKTIHEFGSGFGAMPLMVSKVGFTGNYTVKDFPTISLLREYFLSRTDCPIEVVDATPDHCDLLIALWSLSEADIDSRDIPDATAYLFGYYHFWDGVDNSEWFERFAESRPGYIWYHGSCSIPGHEYLVGVKE